MSEVVEEVEGKRRGKKAKPSYKEAKGLAADVKFSSVPEDITEDFARLTLSDFSDMLSFARYESQYAGWRLARAEKDKREADDRVRDLESYKDEDTRRSVRAARVLMDKMADILLQLERDGIDVSEHKARLAERLSS